jgi:FKBP-type peptidyl-prolyl cis-trans isomerase FkpA/FKBP-type peptidyl-prolyl cis-trans isomerase FklB
MRYLVSWSLALLWCVTSATFVCAQTATTDEQKTLYALGLALSQSLQSFGLNEAELDMVKTGLTDGILKRPPQVEVQDFMPKIQALQQARMAVASEAEKKAGDEFRTKAAAAADVTKTESGLLLTTLTPGNGAKPAADDTVTVHYHGTLIDGTVFDSSVQRGKPATFQLGGVIKCWTEGLQHMQVGGKSRLVCPPEIAYGDRGAPPRIKPGATLIFEVELLEIAKKTP